MPGRLVRHQFLAERAGFLARRFRGEAAQQDQQRFGGLAVGLAMGQHALDHATAQPRRAAHDIKGDAATFGFPSAGAAAESLCRIIEHAPDLDEVPADLITHHINAIQAIVRERTKLDTAATADVLSRSLRGIADEFLTYANRDRPEHLEAILAPSIIPAE